MKSVRFSCRAMRRLLVCISGAALIAGTGATIAAVSAAPAAPHAATLTGSATAAGSACSAATAVATTSGRVCGIVVNGDKEWLGIPYAAPPIGALRWQPPQPHALWTTTLAATAFGSECIQPATFTPPISYAGSEDCLFVNVVRPPGATPPGGLPVLVHIHGGGFVEGNGNDDYTLLANSGREVVVSMNYRLGIFGFLSNSALGANSGDYGLQDQQAALRWVQANIRAFGGNPRNLTIFGESAGGSSVCDQIASPTAAGLFQQAFSVSGEYGPLFGNPVAGSVLENQDCKNPLPTEGQADSVGASFATAVGCTAPADVSTCLRQTPAALVASVAGFGYQLGGQGTIAPTLNGSTLTQTLRQELVTGAVNRVPVIAGTGRDENLIAQANSPSQYKQLVYELYGKFAPRVLALYPLSRFYSPMVAFRTVAADSDTVCPALVTDQDLARWMPVYGYEIDYGDPPPPLGSTTSPTGSAHVAGYFILSSLLPSTGLDANQLVLQTQQISALTSLARTGNPTAPAAPVWSSFNTSNAVMSWAPGGDSQIVNAAQMALIHNCGFWDRISPTP